jgi:hypothetical protein
MVVAAKVWHYWLMVPLFFGSLFLAVALVVQYLVKVQTMRYPRRGQERPRR